MKNLLLIALYSFLPALAWAQPSFTAEADARQVLENSYFNITFTLKDGQGRGFSPPSFEGFIIVNGPSRSMSTTMFNGEVSRTEGYSYTLKPRRKGTFTIGPASIASGSQKLKTQPVTIEVVEGKPGMQASAQQVFIRAEPQAEEAYIGQQILLDYKLYTTLDVENYNILEESGYPGFFAQDVRRFDGRVMREVINGVQYTTKVLKRIALFPQQTGQLKVDAMSVQLGVVEDGANRRRSFFFSPEVKPIPVTTNEVAISVKPLPAGAPPTFTGAVGEYRLTPQLSSKRATTDDAITLLLTVRGDGDIKRVEAPVLLLPEEAFEVYDPKAIEEGSFETGQEISGKKVFEYLLLPRKPGTFSFTPEFTYFSPDSAAYLTLREGAYTLTITPGSGQPASADAALSLKEDIGPLMLDPSLVPARRPFLGSATFWGLATAPFVLFFGLMGFRKLQAQRAALSPEERRARDAEEMVRKRLAEAEAYRTAGDSRACYDAISKAMLGFVSDKLGLPRSALTKDSLEQRLQELKMEPSLIQQALQLVQDCELALFAGQASPDRMESTYRRAKEVLAALEKAAV